MIASLQDLVIPALRPPIIMEASPMLGKTQKERPILLFFRGDFRGPESRMYSRGVRQTLRRLAKENEWAEKYKIFIGNTEELEVPAPYSELQTISKFCLHPSGMSFASVLSLQI